MSQSQRASLGILGIIFGALSIWAVISGSIGVAAAEREQTIASELVASGEGIMTTAKATGVDVHRAGRRSGISYCPSYEYETRDGRSYSFREKRLCEPHWFRPADAELVYRIADPEERYWASDSERKSLVDAANGTRTFGTWGALLATGFGLAVVFWPVRKRSGQS